jgi:hypothetical protein
MTDFLTKETAMSEQTLTAANQAIFHLQLNTDEAIRYVIKTARVAPKEAGEAIKHTLVGYKTKG